MVRKTAAKKKEDSMIEDSMIESSDIREMEAQVASENPCSSEALRYYMKRKCRDDELFHLFGPSDEKIRELVHLSAGYTANEVRRENHE
jgi:hypothetical protein